MIHKIKALYDNGNGLSKRAIAKKLGISRNSVSKYLDMEVEEISKEKGEATRIKILDQYQDYIKNLLVTYPNLSAVKILRKLEEKHPSLNASHRSVRRYVKNLKATINCKQKRYYQPVLDMVPGVQCQVDPGELRGVIINGVEVRVYFVVFVLSFSRLMYVAVSAIPINTEIFIRMHDAAFRYFEGCVEECVYDQTKMVVISEIYRELILNQKFYEYATYAGFQIRACKGYDPESKGKVEAGVKFTKYNGLYGESFSNWAHLESYMAEWLNNIANKRRHSTTGMIPEVHYNTAEKIYMRPYNTPLYLQKEENKGAHRKVDKTGLISWCSNKYSVPMEYQGSVVIAKEDDGDLIILDLITDIELARHRLNYGTGRVIKNNHHYRDLKQLISELEEKISNLIGKESGFALCQLLKATSPKIYRDQLRGTLGILSSYKMPLDKDFLNRLCHRSYLTATTIRDYLIAHMENKVNTSIGEIATTDKKLDIYNQLFIKEEKNVIH